MCVCVGGCAFFVWVLCFSNDCCKTVFCFCFISSSIDFRNNVLMFQICSDYSIRACHPLQHCLLCWFHRTDDFDSSCSNVWLSFVWPLGQTLRRRKCRLLAQSLPLSISLNSSVSLLLFRFHYMTDHLCYIAPFTLQNGTGRWRCDWQTWTSRRWSTIVIR